MHNAISADAWSLENLVVGLAELARLSGLQPTRFDTSQTPLAESVTDIEAWLTWASTRLGLEAEAVSCAVPEVDALLRQAAPAVLQIQWGATPAFLLLYKAKRNKIWILDKNLKLQAYPREHIQELMCAPYLGPIIPEIERLLHLADVPERRQAKVKALLIQERLATQKISACWLVRLPPSASFWLQMQHAGLLKRLLWILIVFMVLYALEIGAWSLIGAAVLDGHLDFGWLSAWSLLVLSLLPLHSLGSWLDATFALDIGRIMKKRLLAGVLRMDLDHIKQQGVGQLLSQVMEAQALEALALNGGFAVVVALIELGFAAVILAHGANAWLQLGLLGVWLLVTLGLSARYFYRLQDWTRERVNMTHALIERMLGHRTRLAQEIPLRRDLLEDQELQTYFASSKALDHSVLLITGALSRGWLCLSLLGIAPVFITGTTNTLPLAVSLGGMLLANRAFSGIAGGLAALGRAAIAWKQVATLFQAAAQPTVPTPFLSQAQLEGFQHSEPQLKLVDASHIVFRYREHGAPILQGANLTLYAGERILCEGPSGGGKSTLAALLVGLRTPESGLLLLQGLDRHTLGGSWQQLATEAPQFHENHIFTGTLAFNLLMGRRWPADAEDLEEARAICYELGLEDLLARMPSGLMQMVGETGWQLSHGERSRIFLARALLQNAQLTILDESFAALDPESLSKCLACAFKRAHTLFVIAHP